MKTRFEIVDVEGDPIPIAQFTVGRDIPVRIRSFRVSQTSEPEMIITLEYLHGDNRP